ncbi:site-specific tyrosine recombinase XerC [Methylibium rhizosphaerae]|uniref:site-specific tyrosine recombinase XerC n=1 Tax=Methylibium rhizosphaerae TaxID=2570323 RepID=UPI0015E29D38|nr:site-specific tyrosine recombinase XerC [Methylibium rhizosphaerae]
MRPRERFTAGAPNDLRGLTAALRRYLEHLGVRGYRPSGMATAERYIREFIGWADERGVTHPQQVTRPVLERYQRWLYHYRKKDGAPLSVSSQRCKLVPLRGFFRWLTKAAEIPANPAADLELPRKIKRLPRTVLTAEEAERVMAGVELETPVGLRDRTMLELLYATGIRRHEIARLELGDIEAERGVMLIREGKGGKDRLLPVGERALYWVSEYLERGRPLLSWNAEDKTLFLGAEGKPLSALWLSTRMAQRVDAAGIGKRGGCHLWRHTMATLMLEGGADLRFIQAMLGHAELSTTQIYTQVAIRQLQAVHAMTHPGAKRRARSAQTVEDAATSHPDAPNAAEALLQTLAREAEQEADEDAGGGVAADA